jgi:hypothetical protein
LGESTEVDVSVDTKHRNGPLRQAAQITWLTANNQLAVVECRLEANVVDAFKVSPSILTFSPQDVSGQRWKRVDLKPALPIDRATLKLVTTDPAFEVVPAEMGNAVPETIACLVRYIPRSSHQFTEATLYASADVGAQPNSGKPQTVEATVALNGTQDVPLHVAPKSILLRLASDRKHSEARFTVVGKDLACGDELVEASIRGRASVLKVTRLDESAIIVEMSLTEADLPVEPAVRDNLVLRFKIHDSMSIPVIRVF